MPVDPLNPAVHQPLYLLQRVSPEGGPCAVGLSPEGTVVQDTFYLKPTALDADLSLLIPQVCKDILGTSRPDGDGGLSRTLPKCHPKYKYCLASAIPSMLGVGQQDADGNIGRLVQVTEELECQPIVDHYWQHAWERLNVTFTSRPYKVVGDAKIPKSEVSWHDEDGLGRTDKFAEEWLRFTDVSYDGMPDWGFADHGAMVFRVAGGSEIGSPEPHRRTFGGKPRVLIPGADVRFRWFGVPFSYVLSRNSYFVRYSGRVNQLEWNGWEPGELIFYNAKVLRRYTPVFPDLDEFEDTGVFSDDKLCDLEFHCGETTRVPGATPPTPTNPNWVAANWNLAYFLKTKKPYYVTSASATTSEDLPPEEQLPMFLSFPFQLLFTDPDANEF